MARANAAKTSTRAASRSGTSTASSAKPKKNAAQADWRDVDALEAEAQGWGVFTCVDEKTKKVFLEIMSEGHRFKTDDLARNFVAMQAHKNNDALALRAARAVFRSKVGDKAKGK